MCNKRTFLELQEYVYMYYTYMHTYENNINTAHAYTFADICTSML